MWSGAEINLVPAVGPSPCDILLVGEAPGENENREKRPFIGKAGGVLSTFLRAAGVARPDVRITNLYPYWTGPKNPEPTEEQIASEEHRLEEEIRRTNPRVIGTLGAFATQWFLGDVELNQVHGVPLPSDKAPNAAIVPCFHPAAGFYNPDAAAFCQDDLMLLAYYAKNPVEVREIPEISVGEFVVSPELRGGFLDTEGLVTGVLGAKKDRVWGLSWSLGGPKAQVWEYDKKQKQQKPPRLSGPITFHNALHDLKILRGMGIDTSKIEPHDTMVKAFVLRLEPQSLKGLAFRHLGLRMKEFDEVVRPYFDDRALRWLKRAAEFEYPKPAPRVVKDLAQRRNRVTKPWDAGRRIKAIVKAYEKAPKELRIEKRWELLGEEFQAQAESRMMAKGRGEFPEFSIFCVPPKPARDYSGTDAAATALVSPILDRMLKAKGLSDVYEMDRRALKFVDRMQQVGMCLDLDRLKVLEADLESIREGATKTIRKIVRDRWFNPGSPQQVANWLYRRKKLPILKFTDTGQGGTGDEALQMLKGYHAEDPEVAAFLTAEQDYREADKYLGTFVEQIFEYARRDQHGNWRLYPNFRVTRVLSGRLSAHEPNVLAIPTRSKLGKRIRECVIAAYGCCIASADYSQIELRTMADHSRDRRMLEAFENREDLHSITAAIIFKKKIEEIEKDGAERYVAKTLNFAIMYGISARALLEQFYKAGVFDYRLEDCERFIAEWFKIYGSVVRFLERTWAEAVRDGFVRDMWGRICYVPNVRLGDRRLLEAAQRLSGNFKIQSGASGVTKRGQTRLLQEIEKRGWWDRVRPFLQMHDELDLEVEEELRDEVVEMLGRVMKGDQERFRVPIEVSVKSGASWAEAK